MISAKKTKLKAKVKPTSTMSTSFTKFKNKCTRIFIRKPPLSKAIESHIKESLRNIAKYQNVRYNYRYRDKAHINYRGAEILLKTMNKNNIYYEKHDQQIEYLCYILTSRQSIEKKKKLAKQFYNVIN